MLSVYYAELPGYYSYYDYDLNEAYDFSWQLLKRMMAGAPDNKKVPGLNDN